MTFLNHGNTRLPHDILVEQGLPPNPGPGGRQEKSSSSKKLIKEEAAEEDNGCTPGYYKHGKGEQKGNKTEEEHGEGRKHPKAFETSETPFSDNKRKTDNQQGDLSENSLF